MKIFIIFILIIYFVFFYIIIFPIIGEFFRERKYKKQTREDEQQNNIS